MICSLFRVQFAALFWQPQSRCGLWRPAPSISSSEIRIGNELRRPCFHQPLLFYLDDGHEIMISNSEQKRSTVCVGWRRERQTETVTAHRTPTFCSTCATCCSTRTKEKVERRSQFGAKHFFYYFDPCVNSFIFSWTEGSILVLLAHPLPSPTLLFLMS